MRRPRSTPDRVGRRPARRVAGPATPAEPAEDPRHQTTVEPIAPSDRPSGPKMRSSHRASAGADPDGGHPQHVRGGPSNTAAAPRAGMGCWVRTAAGGAAVRTPSDRRGEAPPGRPRTAVSGRLCVPAGEGGPGTGTLPRPAGPSSAPPREQVVPPAVAHPARPRRRPRPRARLPRLRPARPRRARPRRAGARRPRASGSAPASGSASSSASRSSCRCCPGPASTSAPSRGWRSRSSRRPTSPSSAAPPR